MREFPKPINGEMPTDLEDIFKEALVTATMEGFEFDTQDYCDRVNVLIEGKTKDMDVRLVMDFRDEGVGLTMFPRDEGLSVN